MLDKIKALLGSIRFWIVTLGAALLWLQGVEADGFALASLLDVATKWLAAVAAIGTFDSVAMKFGEALRGRK